VAEGAGVWKEYAGGYSDWLAQSAFATAASPAFAPGAAAGKPACGVNDAAVKDAGVNSKPPKTARQRLSYKEHRELEALPAQIESLEAEQNELQRLMGGADYHRRGGAQIQQDRARLVELEAELASSFERWAELEARKADAAQ
jgi:ATP-binding cassette subfamily F protein uup